MMGKVTRFLRRPLRAVGLTLGLVGLAELFLEPPPGGSQSVLGVVTDKAQDWNSKGHNIILALKGQITNPEVLGELVGSGVILYASSKLKI